MTRGPRNGLHHDLDGELVRTLRRAAAPVELDDVVRLRDLRAATGLWQPGTMVTTTVSGIIPAPTSNSIFVAVDAGRIVNGIKTAGLVSGTVLYLTFLHACKIVNQATVGTGEAPFYLYHNGAVMNDINWNGAARQYTEGRIVVQYVGTETQQAPCFQLFGTPTA